MSFRPRRRPNMTAHLLDIYLQKCRWHWHHCWLEGLCRHLLHVLQHKNSGTLWFAIPLTFTNGSFQLKILVPGTTKLSRSGCDRPRSMPSNGPASVRGDLWQYCLHLSPTRVSGPSRQWQTIEDFEKGHPFSKEVLLKGISIWVMPKHWKTSG